MQVFFEKMLFHDGEALFSNGPLDSDPGIYTLRTFNANALYGTLELFKL